MGNHKKKHKQVEVVRHRGRRGCFWGDPARGRPGTVVSRATMNRIERTIERRTRREQNQDIAERLNDSIGVDK
jgi:hypothetical protein